MIDMALFLKFVIPLIILGAIFVFIAVRGTQWFNKF